MSPHEHLKQYKDWSPSQFDSRGLGLEDRQDWYVGLLRTRDSSILDESNFKSALAQLGGESDTVEVHRFGHWGPGWFEIILVHPDRANDMGEIVCALADYPVVDEHDLSEREHEAYCESWDMWGCKDFKRLLVKEYDLREATETYLDSISNEALMQIYESGISSGEYYIAESDGVTMTPGFRHWAWVYGPSREHLAQQIKAYRRSKRNG